MLVVVDADCFKPVAAQAKAYDIDSQYLVLCSPLPAGAEALGEAVAKGIRVASQPREEGPSKVSLVLAVPEKKLVFEERLAKPLEQALSDACRGRPVVIVHVAAKPKGFRGGGAPPHSSFLPCPPPY